MMETAQTTETEIEEPKTQIHDEEKKPCVYGTDILSYCTVRWALDHSADPMASHILPNQPGLDSIKEMLNMGMEAFSSGLGKMHTLVTFCAECPYLTLYYEKRNAERLKEEMKTEDRKLKRI